jgi:hypothetical protein
MICPAVSEICTLPKWENQGTQELGCYHSPSFPFMPQCHSFLHLGEKSLILGTKGITTVPGKRKKTDVFSPGPGIVSASYVHFCDTDLCNNASSTKVLLDLLKLSGM